MLKVNENNLITGCFTPNPKLQEKSKETKQAENPTEEKEKPKKISAAIIATALSASVLGGAIMHGRAKQAITSAQNMASDFRLRNQALQDIYDNAQQEILRLRNELTNLREQPATVVETFPKKYADKLDKALNDDVAQAEIKQDILDNLTSKIEECKLDYDVTNPPKNPIKADNFEKKAPLPENVSTNNRANMVKLDIPEIAPDGKFEFTLPNSPEMKITKVETMELNSIPLQKTTISENYADSVQWNNDKIARDILQNFYDGHGQTLDGVKIKFTPTQNGKYTVRIEGKSTYDAENAIYIGESTKRDNKNAAGNYGEGLKMATLKLLKDIGSDSVRIGSDKWKVTYTLEKDNISTKNRRVLAFSLDTTEKIDGNYLEFETSDEKLLESIRNSINRFYHSSNPDFKCPDFENNIIGVKILDEKEKGGFYIAGQRFEVNNDYNGLEGVSIFLKEKPPTKILDPSRDRTSLNKDQIGEIATWLGKSSASMSNVDAVKLLKSLERYWDWTIKKDHPVVEFVKKFTYNRGLWQNLHIEYPEKYIAYSYCSPEVLSDFISRGYKVCHNEFAQTKMKTIHDVYNEARNHDLLNPTDIEKKKILILKEAINAVSPNLLAKKHFDADELDTKIYLFDKSSQKDRRLHDNCNAEAIIESEKSKGFWIDRAYLDEIDFGQAFETALHEMCHKAGGDESMSFSYKLTDVNAEVYNCITTNPLAKFKLQALSDMWENLSKGNV